MIDLEKEKTGTKKIIAGGLFLAAVAAAASLSAQQGRAEGIVVQEESIEAPEMVYTAYAAASTVPAAAIARMQLEGEETVDIIGASITDPYLVLINSWHILPEDYEVELDHVEYGHYMEEKAAEHLREMLDDCRDDGNSPLICSSFRERSKQEKLFQNDVRKFMYSGMSEEEAIKETAKNVAIPGSSEHEAGLAADIVYSGRQMLDERQEDNDTQQWLMEHCWEYGFILRYPRDKQEITGITYEPWHYRYVGVEAAEKIMSEGLCLEEYLGVIDSEPAAAAQEQENE